jgi:hypothetical protein
MCTSSFQSEVEKADETASKTKKKSLDDLLEAGMI